MTDARLTVFVRGRVQGVGFRFWTRDRAQQLGLRGSATNLDDGRVEIVAEGPRSACEQLLADLGGDLVPGRVRDLAHRWSTVRPEPDGFQVL